MVTGITGIPRNYGGQKFSAVEAAQQHSSLQGNAPSLDSRLLSTPSGGAATDSGDDDGLGLNSP